MKVRVLFLGDEKVVLPKDLEEVVELTLETRDEVFDDGFPGRYKVSERSLQLAHDATLKKYDVIIIGNNLGTGVRKAEALPYEVRPRTMIVWNEYVPGDERSYAAMGFKYFGNRYDHGTRSGIDIDGFIRQVIAELEAKAG